MSSERLHSEKGLGRGVWLSVAGVAGAFCLALAAMLFYQHATATNNDPWKSPQLLQLKKELGGDPKNNKIKAEIRELDLKFRQRFARRIALDRAGGWLLLAGLATLFAAWRRAEALRPLAPTPIPLPELQSDADENRQAARARWAVAGVGVAVCAVLAVTTQSVKTGLPQSAAEISKVLGKPSGPEAAPVSILPPAAEFAVNWPRFRGPDGSGFSPTATALLAWDEAAKTGVLWKSAIPRPGFNSPIVWSDRVFLSGGDAKTREVFCYSATDGSLLWHRPIEVPGSPAKQPEISEQTGFAASTMATDGVRVYVIFANGDLAALAVDGTPVWSKHLGVPKNQYGHATSLAIWQGKLVLQMDQGESEPGNSRLTLFDGATGRVVWEKARKVPGSWASPIVAEAAGKTQIITAALPWLIAYDFADGKELWKAEVLEGEITPSPIFAGGLVIVASPSSKLVAIRPDGSGDVTQTHVAWSCDENIPDVTSPASNGQLVFYVNSGGTLTCLDAKDGKKLWDHEFSTEVQSSPGIAGDRVYLTAADGHTWVLEAAREYKELGKGTLEDKFFASPAFVKGRLYLRGNASLYCIGAK